MSEKAVGYTTIGGDLEGALSVIANVPKTVVIALLERLHTPLRLQGHRRDARHALRAPSSPTRRPPKHELMPFPVLDACLHLYAGEKMSPDEVAQALVSLFPGTTARPGARVGARGSRASSPQSIYKWVQSPLSLHVGSLDLDRERALQMPVVQKTEWTRVEDHAEGASRSRDPRGAERQVALRAR